MPCPASVALSDGLPGSSTVYADDGTASHLLSDRAIVHERPAAFWIGEEIIVNGVAYKVDEERAAYVQEFIDRAFELRGDDGVLFSEQRLLVSEWTGEEDAKGTSDIVILRGDELIIDDLKYGMGVRVYAANNEQLMLYALSAYREFGDMAEEIKRVRLCIHQPRLGHFDEWDCSIEDLLAFGEKVKAAAKRVALATLSKATLMQDPDSAFFGPGEKACMWCPIKASCPALAKHIEKTLGAAFEDLTKIPIEELVPTDVHELSTKMTAIELVEDWCRAIRGRLEGKLLEGVAIPGWKLVEGKRGNRKWSDATAVEEALKSMRLKKEEMYDFSLISPTTAEKFFKEEPKRWLRLQQFITRSDGKPSVAPATDKRPAITVNAVAEDFPDHTTSP